MPAALPEHPSIRTGASLESVVASDQIVTAVADLEPRSRALLELAARRGMSDAEMAALLRVRKAEVEPLREQATQQLAVVLKLEGGEFEGLREELARLDEADWERRAVLRAGQPGSAGRQGRSAPVGAVQRLEGHCHHPPKGTRGRPTRIVAAGAVLLALAGIAGVLATRDSHDKHVGTASAAAITPQRGPAVPFQPLNGTHGRGSVRLIRGPSRAQVRLRVVGLLRPQGGGYAVRLYNSPADAHRLAFTTFNDFHGWLRLPRDYARYRFVDISREVPGDPAHSGLSLLRAPLKSLR